MTLQEFQVIFSKDQEKLYQFLEDLIEKKDYRAIIYLSYLLDNLAQKDTERTIDLFKKSFQSLEIPPILKKKFLLFLLSKAIEYKNIDLLIEEVLLESNDPDDLYFILTKLIDSPLLLDTLRKALNLFYQKLEKFEFPLEFKQIYLKKILNLLKEKNRILELEEYLNLLYTDNKKYWVVEALVELYSQKKEYEKLLNVFVSLITSSEFVKVWSESLGIIDKAVEKIADQKSIIPKIIYYLPNINSLAENSPRNIYKIYQSVINEYKDLTPEDRNKFEKSFYDFLTLISNIDSIEEEKIVSLVVDFILNNCNCAIMEKIQSSLKNQNIFSKVVNKIITTEQISALTDFFIKNPDLIALDLLLNQLSSNDYIKMYQTNKEIIKNIDQEIISKLNSSSIDNLINLLIHFKDYDELDNKLKLLLNSKVNLEDLSLTTQTLAKLVKKDYYFVLSNITNFLDYPQVILYVYERLKDIINKNKLNSIFMGIFLYYMDTEMDVDNEILEYFKNKLLEFSMNG